MKFVLIYTSLFISLNTDIFTAAASGDIYAIKSALEHGASIEEKDFFGSRPVDAARAAGKFRAAEFLASLKTLRYSDGGTYTGQMKNGAREGWGLYRTNDGRMYSGSFAGGKICGIGLWKEASGRFWGGELSENGLWKNVFPLKYKDIYITDAYEEGPLFKAVKKGDCAKVRFFIDRGDVNSLNSRKQSPLHFAAFEGRLEIMQLLFEAGALINGADDEGMLPIHFAAFGGQKEAAAMLLERGARVSEKNINGSTPLHLAVYSGSREIAELLLQYGGDINSMDKWGKRPIEHAQTLKNADILQIFQKVSKIPQKNKKK